MFDFLKSMFISKKDTGYKFVATAFRELNLDKISEHLDLVIKGRLNGKKNTPSPEISNFDEIENKIVDYIENEKNDSFNMYQAHLKSQSDEYSNFRFKSNISTLEAIPDNTISNLIHDSSSMKSRLLQQQQIYKESKETLDDFKIRNKINRRADYPESKVFIYGFLLLVLVIESIANGFFLAVGDDSGLVGGVSTAAGIAFVNVMPAFMIGKYIVPYINHYNKTYRIGSWVVVILYFVCIVILMNILVAHYRDIISLGISEVPGTDAILKFKENPFGISDFKSVFLLVIGCVFAMAGLIDGYKSDDKYPGYGALARNSSEAEDHFIDDKILYNDELNKVKMDAIEDIERLVKDIELGVLSFENIKSRRANLIDKFTNHISYLEKSCNSLLTIYRSANIKERSDPAPEYYNDVWSFNQLPDINGVASSAVYAFSINQNKIVESINKANKNKNRIISSFEECSKELNTIADINYE